MRTSMKKLVVTGVTLAVLASPVAAIAQTSQVDRPADTATDQAVDRPRRQPDIDAIKERAQAAIQDRLVRIKELERAVVGSDAATPAHKAALTEELALHTAGLIDLGRQIAAATTLEELRSLVPRIVTEHRIYVLVTPKVKLVLAADRAGVMVERFIGAEARLADAIERAASQGIDVTEARAELAVMHEAVAAAGASSSGVAGSVLPLRPSDWPDPARAVLSDAHGALVSTRESLRQAADAAHTIVRLLREAGAIDG